VKWRAGVVLLVAVLLVACTSEAERPIETPQLDAPFKVVEGSSVVAGLFPSDGDLSIGGVVQPDHGWSAFLRVDGDPRQVLMSYVEQAQVAGMPAENAVDCYDDYCEVDGGNSVEGYAARVSTHSTGANGLYLNYLRSSGRERQLPFAAATDGPRSAAGLSDALDATTARASLPAGTRLLAPAVRVGCTGGFVAAVAKDNGTWEDAPSTFTNLFTTLTSGPPTASTVSDSGQAILHLRGSSAGGITLHVVVHPEQPAVALVNACND
jgi:hypothetical protein